MASLERISRRIAISLLLAGATSVSSSWAAGAKGADLVVYRDSGCGCCLAWAEHARRSGFRVRVIDEADMAAVKRRLGVPFDLASCHTAVVAGLVIEGHVPAPEIVRALSTRTRGVRGLAVAGMPIGSPGMEQPGAGRHAYEVVAFKTDGSRRAFASYPRRAV